MQDTNNTSRTKRVDASVQEVSQEPFTFVEAPNARAEVVYQSTQAVNKPFERGIRSPRTAYPRSFKAVLYTLLILDAMVIGILSYDWFVQRAQPNTVTSTTPLVATLATAPREESVRTSVANSVCPAVTANLTIQSKQLDILDWGGRLSPALITCFESTFGIQVNITRIDSPEQMLSWLERPTRNVDLLLAPDYFLAQLLEKQVFSPLDHARLNVLDQINPSYRSQPFDLENKFTIPYQVGVMGLLFNREQFKTAPVHWSDLWTEAFAARITVPDDAYLMATVARLALSRDERTSGKSELQQISERLLQLDQKRLIVQGADPVREIVSGRADLAIVASGIAAQALAQSSALEFVYPEGEAIQWISHFAIPGAARHMDASYAWLSYSHQAEVGALAVQDSPFATVNEALLDFVRSQNLELFEQYMNSQLINPPNQVLMESVSLQGLRDEESYRTIWQGVIEATR